MVLFVFGSILGGTVGVFASALYTAAKYGDKVKK